MSEHHHPPTHQAFTLYIAIDIQFKTKQKRIHVTEFVVGFLRRAKDNIFVFNFCLVLVLQNVLIKALHIRVLELLSYSFIKLCIQYLLCMP